jgi:hypothetical protein
MTPIVIPIMNPNMTPFTDAAAGAGDVPVPTAC